MQRWMVVDLHPPSRHAHVHVSPHLSIAVSRIHVLLASYTIRVWTILLLLILRILLRFDFRSFLARYATQVHLGRRVSYYTRYDQGTWLRSLVPVSFFKTAERNTCLESTWCLGTKCMYNSAGRPTVTQHELQGQQSGDFCCYLGTPQIIGPTHWRVAYSLTELELTTRHLFSITKNHKTRLLCISSKVQRAQMPSRCGLWLWRESWEASRWVHKISFCG